MLEEAIVYTLQFSSLTNQAALVLLREMEMTRGYESLGFTELRDWAYARLVPTKSQDTVSRLCGVTLNIVASLDARPAITADGEKIDGTAIIAQASASSLMKLSGMFAQSENGERTSLVEQLITGSSDSQRIKQQMGIEPRIGKAVAVFTEYTENDEAMTDIHITATYAQSKVIEKSLAWLLEVRFSERS